MVRAELSNLSTMVDYWERISEAMGHAGVTPKQLQSSLGISYQAMKKLEDGKTKSLSAENNARAARFLGVNSHWLATGEERMLDIKRDVATEDSRPNAEAVTLAQALEVIADQLNTLTDERRAQAAQRLQTLALAPDSQKARAALLAMLEDGPAPVPLPETKDFAPPVPSSKFSKTREPS